MRLIWSRPARDDLRSINNWLVDHERHQVSVRMLVAVRKRAQFLADFPYGGRPFRSGHRILRVHGTPYLIRYRIRGGCAEIIRVHHEREDWQLEP
jgi:toxin ParE1/3/4